MLFAFYILFQFIQKGAEPDIVTVGKPIGNGHPMSAIITTREIADSFLKGRGSYFNTVGLKFILLKKTTV